MEADRLKFLSHSSSIFNFQKCTISLKLIKEIEAKFGNFFEIFISIKLVSRSSRILLRCCKSSVGDVANVIQGDLRVTELILSQSNTERESSSCVSDDIDGSGGGGESREKDDGKSAFHGKEMDLARHLLAKMNVKELKSGCDVDEDEEFSSVRFNDALWCTSKDIQMLKSGTIKKMRLTVIFDSPLSDFPYQTNQQRMTVDADAADDSSSLLSKNLPEDETTSKSRMSSNWKLLREKIRQTFQSYDIHVKSNTLIDLRDCPLSSSRKLACPSVSFVFVEECCMRTSDCDIGKVASKTEILISHVHHISHYKRQLSAFKSNSNFASQREVGDGKLHGLENAAKILSSLIEMQTRLCTDTSLEKYFGLLGNFHSHGLLIAGPSGCGKSLVIRETVKKLRANLLVFSLNVPSSSSQSKSGHDFSSLSETWTEIFINSVANARLYPTVLFIPKIDECLLIRQNKSKSFVVKLLNHVCTLLDTIPRSSMLTVVATTNKPYLIPSKLRRAGRLEREVYIGAPTEKERLNILKSLCKKLPSLRKLDLDSVAKRTPGYVGQDLIRMTHLAILKSYEENCIEVSASHISYSLQKIVPSCLQGSLGAFNSYSTGTSLDHIAGLHSVKLDLIKAIVWPLEHPHAFRIMGITPPKGILLHSPPGCAKTTLVRAVAASHQTNFLSVSAAELFSSGVGDSEKIVADLFHRARIASPCILFIDELEAIVGSRLTSQKQGKTTNESILSMLLTEMDGIGTLSPCVTDRILESNTKVSGPSVLVVAATNRIDMIDSALIRPGRFDKLIYVPPLDASGRSELLRICSKSTPFSSDVNLDTLAADLMDYTGADLINLCREAVLLALTDNMEAQFVSLDNFMKAKLIVSPSLSTSSLKYSSTKLNEK